MVPFTLVIVKNLKIMIQRFVKYAMMDTLITLLLD